MIILPFALAALLPSDPVEQPVAFETLSDYVVQDEAEEEPQGVWQGILNVGGSKTYGNTDIERVSVGVDATKRVDADRYTLGFLWNYGSEDGEISERKAFASGKYDHFLNEKSYLYGLITAVTDDQANITYGYTAGGGYGRQIIDNDEWKLDGEVGVSYVYEEYDTDDIAAEEGIDEDTIDEDNDYVALRLAYDAAWNYSERWQFSQRTEVLPSFEDPTDDVSARVDTRATASLTENMFGQLQHIFAWDNSPAEGSDRDDHLLLLSIGWKF